MFGAMTNILPKLTPFTLLTLACIFCCFIVPSASNDLDIDIGNKAGSRICLLTNCDDSGFFHYYTCCGTLAKDCCFRLQTWVIIVLIVLGISILAGAVGGIVKCICCCDR